MSYFDGIIPNACRSCFAWDGQKWVQIDEGLCDACEYMLDMFPILDADKAKERDNLALLSTLPPPEWSTSQKTR